MFQITLCCRGFTDFSDCPIPARVDDTFYQCTILPLCQCVSPNLYNRAPCGYHSLDANGTIVQINDTELGWIGYTREEVIGRLKFTDLITAESRAVFARNFPIFMAEGHIENLAQIIHQLVKPLRERHFKKQSVF